MLRGKVRTEPNTVPINFDFDAKIHNRFDIEVIDSKTGKLKTSARGYNVICDQLWTRLGAGYSYFNYICYGGGSGTPSATDTSLFEHIGGAAPSSDNDVVSVDYNTGVFSYQRRIQLSESTAVGKTITEVGIAYGSTSTYLCTHAMLQDMNGNPISIEKSATDVINIYATVYVHFAGDGFDNGSIRMPYYRKDVSLLTLFAGVGLSYGLNVALFSSTTWLRKSDGSSDDPGLKPSDFVWQKADSSLEHRTGLTSSWDSANKSVTFTATRLGVNKGNMGGILRFMFAYYKASWGIYDYHMLYPCLVISPGGSWFPYSEIQGEAVGTGDGSTTDFTLDFPYAHDAEIYVDGELTTDVVVDYAIGSSRIITDYVEWLDPSANLANNRIPYYGVLSSYVTSTEGCRMFYNPMYQLGLYSIYLRNTTLYASNDAVNWEVVTTIGDTATTYAIPDEFSHYKYWKGTYNGSYYCSFNTPVLPSTFTGKTLHFTTPPAEGASIVANYKSDCFAKDENHVFDLSITFHFGEYAAS